MAEEEKFILSYQVVGGEQKTKLFDNEPEASATLKAINEQVRQHAAVEYDGDIIPFGSHSLVTVTKLVVLDPASFKPPAAAIEADKKEKEEDESDEALK